MLEDAWLDKCVELQNKVVLNLEKTNEIFTIYQRSNRLRDITQRPGESIEEFSIRKADFTNNRTHYAGNLNNYIEYLKQRRVFKLRAKEAYYDAYLAKCQRRKLNRIKRMKMLNAV